MIKTQYEIDGVLVTNTIKDALNSDDVEFYYNPKGCNTLFPLIVIHAKMNEELSICLKMVCSADSVWRKNYRDIIFKNLKVHSVGLLNSENQEQSIDVKKSEIEISDFVMPLVEYFERLKSKKIQEDIVGFKAWRIDPREVEMITKSRCVS